MMPDTVRFDEKNVFPYAVAKAPETKIDFTRIVQEKNIDLFGNDQKIHMNPIVPGTGHEISFVASPYCAYIYKELIDMTDRYRQLHDTHFTWIGHTLNYIKAHPLADAPFEMPKRFRPTI
ncbi:MAG: hypothetical protein KKF44_05235 [Nanoarchaeota archaeon]|nr:hypothetical protein [Nanoarchaeota archaeon]